MPHEGTLPFNASVSRNNEESDVLFSRLRSLLPQSPLHLSLGRRASVALILRQRQVENTVVPVARALSSLELLFIQRTARPTDPWSAHIAFPGGHREQKDDSDLHAAVRETHEEVGIDLTVPGNYRVLGRLSDRPFRSGNKSSACVLCAFVFLQMPSANPELSPQPTEVAKAFWTPLDVLHGREVKKEHIITMPTQDGWIYDLWKVLGFSRMRMPAIEVLQYANDSVAVADVIVPDVLLWGMTLGCVGDLVQSFGGRRVDWPAALPENKLAAGLLSILAEGLWWVCDYGKGRSGVRDYMLIEDSR